VADLIRSAGAAFVERIASGSAGSMSSAAGHWPLSHRRTRGHLDECTRCGIVPHLLQQLPQSTLPKVSDRGRERWIAARQRELLPTRYVHWSSRFFAAHATGLAE